MPPRTGGDGSAVHYGRLRANWHTGSRGEGVVVETENRELIGQLLMLVRDGLQPVVDRVLTPLTPSNRLWTVLLEERDRVAGRTGHYAPSDLQTLLIAMTGRLGSLGFPFTPVLGSRANSLLPEELRKVRNDWAHMAEFSDSDTDRALDSGARLLRAVAAKEADAVEAMLSAHRRQRYGDTSTTADVSHPSQQQAPPPVGLTVPNSYNRAAEPADDAHAESQALEPASPQAPRAAMTMTEQQPNSEPASAEDAPRPAPFSRLNADGFLVGAVPATSTDSAPVTGARPASPAAVTITAETLTTLSYAMAHNAISPISSIELTSTEDVRGAVLEIALHQDSGPIGAPQQYYVDLARDQPTLVPVRRFVLDGSAMLALESPRPGRFEMTVRADDRVLGSARHDVDLLAAQQWRAVPLQLGLEMLPAHVTPHHPLLRPLLLEAADVLRDTTDSAALDAYQGEDDRVDAIVLAISTAMQKRDVRYANPPASWGDGQIVRTVDEVLDGGLGTCLDTSAVLAAALEQAGVNPILLMFKGHANVGYWRQEGLRVPDELLTDANTLVNLVDTDHIGIVETTRLTDAAPLDLAEQRRRTVARYLRGDRAEDFVGAVDVAEARRTPVLPLPVRTKDADGGTVIVEYAQVAQVLPAREDLRGKAAPSAVRDEPERVTRWKGALLDLSLRNRLLNFTDSARLPLLLPEGAAGEVENLLHAGRALSLIPNDRFTKVDQYRGDVRTAGQLDPAVLTSRLRMDRTAHVDLSSVTFSSRMLKLASNARTIAEETGANNLYLAVGSLIWSIKGKAVRSPLILIPVALKAKGRGDSYTLSLDETGGSTPNFCLIEKLRQEMNVSIPELENPAQEESGIDIDGTLRAVRRALIEKGLPFQVEGSLDLAILQFAKFRLWKDLDEHWSEFAKNPLVKHLIDTPDLPFQQAPVEVTELDALAAQCPIPADASQLGAVSEALQGRTFVLEGPPGTGKSQTITNLLARSIAEGKRVLFVAEKRAALEVVQRRLESVGLAPFALDLHDKASRINELRRQLRESLDAAVEVDRNALEAASATVRRTTATLSRYADSVHERSPIGLSLYDARLRELSLPHPATTLELTAADIRPLTEEQVRSITLALEAAIDTTPPARPRPRHGWSFIDDPSARRADPASLLAAAELLESATAALSSAPIAGEIDRVRDPADLRAAAAVLAVPDSFPFDFVERAGDARWRTAGEQALTRLASFASTDHAVLRTMDRSGLELPLEQLRDEAQAAAASSFFGRKKRLRAVAAKFGPALGGNGDDPSVLKQLQKLAQDAIEVRTARDAAGEGVFSVPGLAQEAGDPFDVEWPKRLAARRAALMDLADRWSAVHEHSPLRAYVGDVLRRRTTAPAAELPALLTELADAIDGLDRQLDDSPEDWLGDDGWTAAWRATAADRALDRSGSTTLHRWLQHVEGLRPLLAAAVSSGLRTFYERLIDGTFAVEDAPEAFELAVATASVSERTVGAQLDDFSASMQDDAIERFRRGLTDVQRLLPDALPHELLGHRRFDAAASTGQVGRLRRELERQRGGLPIRKLLEEFHDLVLSITPCVLVSPESVARFFPADQHLFDMVVFDEASQVRVADAIGAMGRATSVVVVGDSKQMPPSTFAQVGGGIDEESGLTASGDEESILTECVRAQVPSNRLTWHYRSRHEALIAFSNEHYYDSKLASFPSPREADVKAVIDFARVDGQFLRTAAGKEKRTNPIEAQAIVSEIERRFADAAADVPSLGVVTFNKEQRDLIETLLRQSSDDRIGEALDEKTEGLFVKNLENVQGDERDTILFSIAFSKNEKGDLPLNFGPLTRSGGERRLNVAVTRARAEVVLFCSFDPSELRAEETQSVGIKHLRDYLRLAQQGRPDALAMKRRPRPDAHRDDIAAVLADRGLAVMTDVGLSDFRIDIAVADPSEPESDLVAILLDTPEWHHRRTVHDRDVLPIAVLGGQMQWRRVMRVWLPDWLANRDAVLRRIDNAVVDAKARRASAPATPAPPKQEPAPRFTAPEPSIRYAAAPTIAPPREPDYQTRFTRFVPWTYRGAGTIDVLNDLPRAAAGRRVGAVLSEIVRHEGPVHFKRLARLAAAEFGLTRVNADRTMAILRQLDPSHIRQGDQSHAWPANLTPNTWPLYRWSGLGDDRDLRSISPVELANAMRHIAEESAGIEEDPLFREVLTRFGAKRLTEEAVDLLKSALAEGQRLGRLRQGATGAVLPG